MKAIIKRISNSDASDDYYIRVDDPKKQDFRYNYCDYDMSEKASEISENKG